MISEQKYKICRRLGTGVFDKCQTQKFALSESKRTGVKKTRGKQPSDYGAQLLEKQKVRLTYGLKEKQFSKYVKDATNARGVNIYEKLFADIESRLDNVIYRLGLAETRAKARQIVTHGHIILNGKKMNIPSCRVSVGDVVGIRPQSENKGIFVDLEKKTKERSLPKWLSFDIKKKEGKVLSVPKSDSESMFDLKAVFEFYSR